MQQSSTGVSLHRRGVRGHLDRGVQAGYLARTARRAAREATDAARKATDDLSPAERSDIVRVLVAAARTRTNTLGILSSAAGEKVAHSSAARRSPPDRLLRRLWAHHWLARRLPRRRVPWWWRRLSRHPSRWTRRRRTPLRADARLVQTPGRKHVRATRRRRAGAPSWTAQQAAHSCGRARSDICRSGALRLHWLSSH